MEEHTPHVSETQKVNYLILSRRNDLASLQMLIGIIIKKKGKLFNSFRIIGHPRE